MLAAVMIGVGPHKGSHTAVAIGAAGEPLGELRVRSPACQAGQLVAWAAAWPQRTWAWRALKAWGTLLARQLAAMGERVLDVLERITPSGAVAAARCELAADFVADLRRIDARMRGTRKKLTVAVQASGTTLTEIFGVGPVIAVTVIGYAAGVSRFPARDHFAACNGTAPVEVSSGNRTVHRLSRRGNRRLNHVIHMAAVTQIRHLHSQGRPYYDRKLAEGKTAKEALRSLKRRASDAIYRGLKADARRAAAARAQGPGGQRGNDTDASAAGSHPGHRLFGQATPGPVPTPRSQPSPQKKTRSRATKKIGATP